jgi:hypothetical protein
MTGPSLTSAAGESEPGTQAQTESFACEADEQNGYTNNHPSKVQRQFLSLQPCTSVAESGARNASLHWTVLWTSRALRGGGGGAVRRGPRVARLRTGCLINFSFPPERTYQACCCCLDLWCYNGEMPRKGYLATVYYNRGPGLHFVRPAR